ncbi:ATPase [Sphaerisporangium siamense]|uniref:histidine kinase n=1 Tax=Sphaerisporangium siamense TaxID=795645 RepID=A0A7W7GE11_9ACTN|nr:histidine kinase [Sphaerisporangium siamense]MBB4705024.1 signal transduction histidine kinase [Sphaerisporangium siamense]GII83830.1 ATPase [Sphaerisporangium siamense]
MALAEEATGAVPGTTWRGRAVRRAVRLLAGLALGTVTAPAELACAVAGAAALPFRAGGPRGRHAGRAVEGAARWLAALELRRLRFCGARGLPESPARGSRPLAYVAARWPVGLLGGAVLLLLAIGAGTMGQVAAAWLTRGTFDDIPPTPWIVLYIGTGAALLLFLDVMGMIGVLNLDRALAVRLLGPSPTERLERRITELAETRAGVVAAVDQERRRIERDLHDGLQQRLVALAVLIGRARRGRSPELLDALLAQAHQEARAAIGDLREVAWRAYPSGLDSLGLQEALATLAERAAVPVRVEYGLEERPAPHLETAAYFVACEAVTNAAKHAGAGLVTVRLARAGTMLVVRVHDDGRGGADPAGGGLSGLARRVAALDGRLAVHSPPGGPTSVTAELPCG